MYQPTDLQLYINSFLHYGFKKSIDINGENKEIHTYYLDRRFTTTNNLDDIQKAFPYCNLKHQDKYYISIRTIYPINSSTAFYTCLNYGLIVSISEFKNFI